MAARSGLYRSEANRAEIVLRRIGQPRTSPSLARSVPPNIFGLEVENPKEKGASKDKQESGAGQPVQSDEGKLSK